MWNGSCKHRSHVGVLTPQREGEMKASNHLHKSNAAPLLADNRLPADAAWLFPEYDFDTMGVESHESVIIERVLERGTWEQLRWLFATYGEASAAEWVRRHGFRLLSRRSFALWRLALGVTDYVAPEWAVEAKRMEPW
jgi:hypothetical protein